MADPTVVRKELMNEIENRKNMGDKKYHSETFLQNFGEEEEMQNVDKDPGVQNTSMNGVSEEERTQRVRAASSPGPVSGALVTATAARAARKKTVGYASNEPDRLSRLNIPKTFDDPGTATPTGDRDRSSPFPPAYNGNFLRNGDTRSLSSYKTFGSTQTTPRKRFVITMDAQSIRSVETQAPPPTSPEENKNQTKKYLTLVISSMYAVLLVTLGLIINIGDPFVDFPVATVYSIFLGGIGFFYHIFLIIDINRYKTIALKNQKIRSQHDDKIAEYFRKQEEEYGDRTPDSYKNMGLPTPDLVPIKHNYCFNQGRHSGSFYLKLGAAGFALGNLVHSILLIVVQLGYLFDDDVDNESCVEYSRVALDFFNPVYCFLQLFFVFKYSNVIVLRAQGLARFAFMHMIGSSLCFWVNAIVRETILALTIYAQYLNRNNYNESESSSSKEVFITPITVAGQSPYRILNVSNLFDEDCIGNAAITSIFESFSPYLYPFSVEFNILIVAVYYIIWSNIGHCHGDDISISEQNDSIEDNISVCRIPTANEENDFTSNMVIYADCHASNKGLFAGLMVTVVIVGMLIIGFVFNSVGEEFAQIGYVVSDATKLGVHSIMLFASILAFTQTRKLDINEHPISLLDDILLFICLPPFFMETVFSLVATLTIMNIVKSIDFIIMVIQVLIQTPLIMDALRRCSNTRKLRRKKPARELIMFLLITNVGMWLFYTFSYKAPDSRDERYEYYGKVLWTILGHVSLPLIMFYRFHSSVCFADIWDSAYKPGIDH